MKRWPVQDAKARFSEFLQASLTRGPQLVTMRGEEAAVLVSVEQWRRLNARARPGVKALLLEHEAPRSSPSQRVASYVAERRKRRVDVLSAGYQKPHRSKPGWMIWRKPIT